MRHVSLRSLWGALAVFAIARSAGAETTDEMRSAARNLASEGLRAFQAGNDEVAIDRFARAEAIVHAPTHLLYQARASVRLGKLVQAKELYVKIAREEFAPSAPKAFVEAQKAAAAEAFTLEPRIPLLTIVVTGNAADSATVTLDGVEIPRALVGVASPTNPGAHKLHAAAPGWDDVEASVTLAEGARETSTLALSTERPLAAGATETLRKKSIAPWIAFGVAAAGLGVGTVFVLKNRGDRDDADAICGSRNCPPDRRNDIQALDSSANRAATFAWIGYGVAGAAAVTGATLLFLQRPKRLAPAAERTGVTVMPWMGAGSGGFVGWF